MRPLEEAIEIIAKGNKSEFARQLSEKAGRPLSQQLVSKWVNKANYQCSPKFAPHIEELTEGKVTKESLCPDVFFQSPSKAA